MPSRLPWRRIALVGIFVAEAFALVLVAWSMRSVPTDGVAVRPNEATLTVSDQVAVTSVVHVDRVVAPASSWVVLQVESATGSPGAILGSVHIDQGEYTNLGVPIEAPVLPRLAVATLVADLGNQAELEYAGAMNGSGGMGMSSGSLQSYADKPYVANGEVVMARFAIKPLAYQVGSSEATIGAASRDATGTRVFATGVVAPGPSWLSVSVVTSSGAPGAILAYAPVQSGNTPTVTVSLLSAMNAQPLYVTLHADRGRSGQFDYSTADATGSPDQPYVAGGRTVRILLPAMP
jgi:hypothetical protein